MLTLSLAAPSLTPKQLAQVAQHLTENEATPFPPDGALLMVAGTRAPRVD
jgi:hypothetical protein